MSAIPPSLNQLMQFYLSGPLPCPYLPDRVERKLFMRLTGAKQLDSDVNAALTRAGFRRSHDIIYRPACAGCSACTSVRIPVRDFAPGRSLRRIARRNADLVAAVAPAVMTDELFDLFLRYQLARHPDSDMARMTPADFSAMLREGDVGAQLYLLRRPSLESRAGELVGCIIADPVADGFSAVYSFFAPDEPERSLGIQLILTLIDAAAAADLPYVYLGYWIAAARKMAYKRRFQPLQALGPSGWVNLD